MQIGFVGLGRMGLPMARNLLRAGHFLAIHSGNVDAVRALVSEGAHLAGSVRELAQSVEVLCSCRVSPEHSIDTFLGPEGAVAADNRALLCIDFATVDPATSRRLGTALAERGIGFLDAPISGGPDGAKAASLTIMAGGSEADFARAGPVFEAVGRKVFHVGGIGSGVGAKLCNNLITGTLHVLIAEAMVLGTKLGIDPPRLYEVLHASSARSTTLERVVPNHFLPGNYEPASALVMMIKDLECVMATAKAAGVRLLLPTLAQQCYIEAAGLGHGQKDLAAVILPMEAIAGVRVGRGPSKDAPVE